MWSRGATSSGVLFGGRFSFAAPNGVSRVSLFPAQYGRISNTTNFFSRNFVTRQSKNAVRAPTKQLTREEFSLVPKRWASTNSISISQALAKSKSMLMVGTVAAGGIGALALYGFTQSTPSLSSSRVRKTYIYFAGSLGISAAVARWMYTSGAVMRVISMNPILFMVASLGGMIGTQILLRSIPYENTIPKHLAWGAFCGIMGAAACPLSLVGGPILMNAAAATGAILSGLTLVAAAAPSDYFLQYAGPATIGLGVVLAASWGSVFFPASSLLYSVATYGGAGIFSFFILMHTNDIHSKAKLARHYDPIDQSIGLYVATFNLFTTLVQILSGNRRK